MERQAAEGELTSLRTELRKARKASCGDQPVTNDVANLEEGLEKTEHRLTEILQELESLDSHAVDENDVRIGLAQFGPVWGSLNSREQARIIQTLIDQIVCNGKTNYVSVRFRSAGIREMCHGNRKEERNTS